MSTADSSAEKKVPLTETDIYPGSPVLHARLIQGVRDFFGLREDNQVRGSNTIFTDKYSPTPGEKIPPEGLTIYEERCIALLMLNEHQTPTHQERIYCGTKYLQEPNARTLRIFETETVSNNGKRTTVEKALAHINFSPDGTILEILLWNDTRNHLTSFLRTSLATEGNGNIPVIKILAT